MVSSKRSNCVDKKLLMLAVAHFVVTSIVFADGAEVLVRSPVVLELTEGLPSPKKPVTISPVSSGIIVEVQKKDDPDIASIASRAKGTDEQQPWEVVEDPQVVFARNASQPLVSTDGSANPNAFVLQRPILDLNDLSYLVAKSQSKKEELEKLKAKLTEIKLEIDELEVNDDPFGLDEEYLDDLYNERDDLGVKIQNLKKEIKENDARKDILQQEFVRHGWVLKVFKGKTGYKPQFGDETISYVDDDRGIVAYEPNTRSFVICYHGSRNQDDWKTNLDGKKIKASEAGLLLGDIEIHRGFAYAAASCTTSICSAIDEILASGVSVDGLNFWLTGHSQGAGVAALGLADLALRLGKRFYGPGFDNTTSNTFKGLLLSAPRAVAANSLAAYHAIVGERNAVRQNVDIDPVPVASLRNAGPLKNAAQMGGTIVSAAKTIASPIITAGSFIDRHTGILTATGKAAVFADSGIMAVSKVGNYAPVKAFFSFIPGAPTAWKLYQYTRNAIMTTNAVSTTVSKVVNDPRLVGVRAVFETQEAGEAVDSITGYAGVGQLALDPTAEVGKRAIWSSIKAWAGRVATNTLGLFKTRTRFDGQPASVDELMFFSLKDLGTTLFAPAHYGSTAKGANASFDPNVVGTDLDTMLANGRAHQEAAAATQQVKPKGFFAKAKEKVLSLFGK